MSIPFFSLSGLCLTHNLLFKVDDAEQAIRIAVRARGEE